jgi:flagellin
MLNRMYSLAEQSANGTYDEGTDRYQLQKEVEALRTEINRIADSSNFNGMNLLDGSLSSVQSTTTPNTFGLSNARFEFVSGVSDAEKETFEQVFDGSGVTGTLTYAKATGTITLSGLTGADDAGATQNYALKAETVKDNSNNNITVAATTDGGTISLANVADQRDLTALTLTVTHGGKDIGRLTFNLSNIDVDTDATTSTFNLKAVGGLELQIGDTSDSYNIMEVSVTDMHAASLGIDNIDISKQDGAQLAMNALKAAINCVSDTRGGLGATQNRLEHTINNLSVMQENIQDAESTIRDTDVADEMMKYTKNSILVQSAQAMLAQANQQPQGVLQLLQ